MNQAQKDIGLEAFALKKQSLERAQKGAKPRFAELIETDLADLEQARKEFFAMKATA